MSSRSKPDSELLTALGQRAVRKALRVHKALGQSIVVWEDGKVVEVPAKDIDVPPVEDDPFPISK